MYICRIIKNKAMKIIKAIKTENKNGTFNYILENGEVIIKNTKKNYNAFALSYYINTGNLNRISSSSKGLEVVSAEALRLGFKANDFFIATIK